MAIIKCKMCGGDIELTADKTFGTCEFCGSTMTLPKIDDDQRAAAFNRGNHFRRIGEFDKALSVYERIVREDDTDAEAHWCCALCRFGIEYVEDPATYEYLPTCHRASFDSFLEDVDYLAAVEHSDGITKRQYQKDAAKIAEVQRGILATSQNAEPYDVFICYKESDANGDRTRDSLLAQDIYYQLTEQGRKVFFARITLEDVAGTQYEPYIFAALNSAKVMIVVGTKPEYLNAVWVKNEWSRFLAMMKKDRHKLLLPCYRDMDPYDMPEALSVLQSYDMSKIGFIQDLTRGIAKVLDADKKPEPVKETVVVQQNAAATNTAPLLKRAFMFLEDGDWNSANEYCEKVLDIDPECAEAYLGKLMAELHVKKQNDLQNQAEPFDGHNNYQKALRFADDFLKGKLRGYIEHINVRNENARLDDLYTRAQKAMSAARKEREFKETAQIFDSIGQYLDAASLAQKCYEKAEEARKDAILADGKAKMNGEIIARYEGAIKLFESISGWKDADEMTSACRQMIGEIKTRRENERKEAERKSKRNKRIMEIATPIILVITVFIVILNVLIIPNIKYNNAIALMDAEKYNEAISAFEAMDGYKDSISKIEECNVKIFDGKYNDAIALMDAGKYSEAILSFEALDDYKDSMDLIPECRYLEASALMDGGKYSEAVTAFEALYGYKDSMELILECHYLKAMALMEEGKYTESWPAFEGLGKYKDSAEMVPECKYRYAVALMEAGEYGEAKSQFMAVAWYKDSKSKLDECNMLISEAMYNSAIALINEGNVIEAYKMLNELGGYKDSVEKAASIHDQYKNELLRTAKPGEYIIFGTYEQDGNKANGKEDIEWRVLEIKDGKALAISRFGLEKRQYNSYEGEVSWESSTLRNWLNKNFYNSAFSAEEKKKIILATVSADANPNNSANSGRATKDKVFLLSITEVKKYFKTDAERECKDVQEKESAYGHSWWWLRTSAGYSSQSIVSPWGKVDSAYYLSKWLVRPAIWIDLADIG